MAVTLPDDVLNLIAAELWAGNDFNALFNFSLANRQLAALGLGYLYRMQDIAPVKRAYDDPSTGPQREAARRERQRKWMCLWKSIILSTQEGTTIMPYARYIRVLDLPDLSALLDELNTLKKDEQWKFYNGLNHIEKKFVAEGKGGFPTRDRTRKLPVDESVVIIGEEIIRNALFLEELGGKLPSSTLLDWFPSLPRLRVLRLYNGRALVGCAQALREHCPSLDSLFILNWFTQNEVDEEFAEVLSVIKPLSLRSMEILGNSFGGDRSVGALALHRETLTNLTIPHMKPDMVNLLPDVGDLPLLEAVTLGTYTSLLSQDVSIQTRVGEWLQKSPKLRSLTLRITPGSGLIVAKLLQNEAIQLRQLDLRGPNLLLPDELSVPLAAQQQLESLFVDSAFQTMDGDDTYLEWLLPCMYTLKGLRKLRMLGQYPESFILSHHIGDIALDLPDLEELSISGGSLSDEIFPPLMGLRKLKQLMINGTEGSVFTFPSILEFIQLVDPQKGVHLELMGFESPMGASQLERLQEEMVKRNGTFSFAYRDEDSDSDGSEFDVEF